MATITGRMAVKDAGVLGIFFIPDSLTEPGKKDFVRFIDPRPWQVANSKFVN